MMRGKNNLFASSVGRGNKMDEPQSWRELLAIIIRDPHERQRIAGELSVSTVTLNRWVRGESAPRPHNLRHLLSVVPQFRDELLELLRLEEDTENLIGASSDDSEQEIPASFYIRVFNARASTV